MSNRTLTWAEIIISSNVYWDDAFQFGYPDDQTWSFTGMSFLMDLKVNASDVTPVLSMSSSRGTIVVDDVNLRILHFYVSDTALRAALTVGTEYRYDLIMVNNSTGERDGLMEGTVKLVQGVTVED